MLAARADFTLEGPGLAVHVHGEGPVLLADVRSDIRNAARALRRAAAIIRIARAASRSLRASGLRVQVRIAGRTFVRLG